MAEIPIQPHAEPLGSDLQRGRPWFLVTGIVLVILGILAIGTPLVMGLATAVFIGWLLIIGGILEVGHGLWHRQWRGFFLDLLIGVLYVAIGFMVVANPAVTLATLTLLIAMFLILEGFFLVVTALSEHLPHRGWMLLNGVVSLVLGVLIWRRWPLSGLWVIGLFVGIELLLHGWSLIMLGLMGRSPTARGAASAQPAY